MDEKSQLTLFLLGPLQTSWGNNTSVAFATDKVRALLAYLAVEADRPHRRETLAGLLWSNWSDAEAITNLRRTLHRLKQSLGALTDALLTITRQTVQLNSQFVTVDFLTRQRLISESEKHSHQHLARCSACLARLEEANQLYRGEFLSGFYLDEEPLFEEWLVVQRERIHQQQWSLLTHLADSYEKQGGIAQVIACVGRQLEMEGWREECHQRLMRLLAANGQRSAALAQYESCRRILAESLGVEPSSATQKLYQQIKGQVVPEVAPAGTLHYFPLQLTPFYGRQAELAQIQSYLQDDGCRFVTLTGLGGIGKSRLAIEAAGKVAAHFPDGLYFIALAGLQNPQLLPLTIAGYLNLSLQGRQDPQVQIQQFLRGKQILLAIDNFEQFLAASEKLLALLSNTNRVKLLITSREPLRMSGEWQLGVEGLEYPAGTLSPTDFQQYSAIQLFCQIARQVRPAFNPVQEQKGIIAICQYLRGMPLALEIAGRWAQFLDCATIANQIRQDVDFLTASQRDIPERQQSIRAIFDYTWKQLDPAGQSTLAQLAIFPADFTAQAAQTIAQTNLFTLAHLLDKSLLHYTAGRYTLHPLLRQLALEKLDRPADVQNHFCHYYLELVAAQYPKFRGDNPAQARLTLQAELENIRQAWDWAIEHSLLMLLSHSSPALALFYSTSGYLQEATLLFTSATERLLAIGLPQPDLAAILSQLWFHQANFVYQSENQLRGIELANRALDTALTTNQPPKQIATIQSLLGLMHTISGQSEVAMPYLDAAMAYFQTTNDGIDLALVHLRKGTFYYFKQEWEQALYHYQLAYQLDSRYQHKIGIARGLGGMGMIYSNQKQHDLALTTLEKALELDREIGSLPGIARHLNNIAWLYDEQKEWQNALAYYQEALSISRQMGYRDGIGRSANQISKIYIALGQLAEADRQCDMALAELEEGGSAYELAYGYYYKAQILLRRGLPMSPFYEKALEMAQTLNQESFYQLCLALPDSKA